MTTEAVGKNSSETIMLHAHSSRNLTYKLLGRTILVLFIKRCVSAGGSNNCRVGGRSSIHVGANDQNVTNNNIYFAAQGGCFDPIDEKLAS